MSKLILIDGNSIINRAFYGIMGNKMLSLDDGTYTNAVYGFLSILFKVIEDINPKYLAVAFDLRAPTKRHEKYEKYKATRKGMPDELASQMPIVKEILTAMNIKIFEKEGYEADDILGTLAKWGAKQNLDVTILTGDRDSFQLIDKNITVRIPRTKMGKTETSDYTEETIMQEYELNPIDLIEVKALMGDSSDNIPGVPGIGEKTALALIKEYKTLDKVYENVNNIKGKTKEKLIENKELAYLSKDLGTVDINVPIEKELKDIEYVEWNKQEVLSIFRKLKFKRFIERFKLEGEESNLSKIDIDIKCELILNVSLIKEKIENAKIFFYYIEKEDSKSGSLNKKAKYIFIYIEQDSKVYYSSKLEDFKEIFENKEILKCGYNQKEDYILLKQLQINVQNLMFDIEIAGYILNSNISKYTIKYLANEYLNLDIEKVDEEKLSSKAEQINLFDVAPTPYNKEPSQKQNAIYVYAIKELYYKLEELMKSSGEIDLFRNIEMPLVEVLADMQYTGIYVDKQDLVEYGKELEQKIEILKKEIYNLSDEEFNINSVQQLGKILFEKLELPVLKKSKRGYSTDSEVLEKLKSKHPIVEKILEYRQLVKLNSTYVEGLVTYIDDKTKRIHSSFMQTVTATGRISSNEPNLQNIPIRFELGRRLRKIFEPDNGYVFVDSDYSQIELRILSHISGDTNMCLAFNNNEDIHKQVASRVFNVPMENVTKEERTKAKAVNFGIIYGISDFGLRRTTWHY